MQTWSFRQKYFLLHFQRSFCLLYIYCLCLLCLKGWNLKDESSNSTFQTNGQTYISTSRATFSQLKNLFLLGNRNQENHRHFDGDLQGGTSRGNLRGISMLNQICTTPIWGSFLGFTELHRWSPPEVRKDPGMAAASRIDKSSATRTKCRFLTMSMWIRSSLRRCLLRIARDIELWTIT